MYLVGDNTVCGGVMSIADEAGAVMPLPAYTDNVRIGTEHDDHRLGLDWTCLTTSPQ